jgi:hypothetical protein
VRRLTVKVADCSDERLCRIALRAGFKVYPGSKHWKVETTEGQWVTTIPRHRRLKREIVKAIIHRLEEFGANVTVN